MDVAIRREMHVKAAVIDRLLASPHMDSDAVLISEMTIAKWSRRADMVLANGLLWAFEIKSDLDSLARLPGQMEDFRHYFEKFTVVAAERFEKAIIAMVPDGVGVWILGPDGETKQKIASKQSVLTKDAYLSLMTATELRGLAVANGRRPPKAAPRGELEAVARDLPVRDLASAARNAVKCRHRARHLEFIGRQRRVGTLEAISTLRRPSQNRHLNTSPQPVPLPTYLQSLEIPFDHPQFVQAPGGPVLMRKIS